MGVCIAGLGTFNNSGHMAAHTATEGVNGVSQVVIDQLMALHTLLRTGPFGLKLRGGQTQLVDVMAGGTIDSFTGMG